jgi:hypothetical protein
MSNYGTIHDSILGSSLIQNEVVETRYFFLMMVAIKNSQGIVYGTAASLARLFNVDVEIAEQAIKALEAPDAESRTPDDNGCRIRKVQGGWLVVNHKQYRGNAPYRKQRESASSNGSHPAMNGSSIPSDTQSQISDSNIRDYSHISDSRSPTTQETQESSGVTSKGTRRSPEGFSEAEGKAYGSLTSDCQRGVFLTLRGWAARAAANGEPDFGASQKELARQERCDQTNISDILRKLRDDGVVVQTQPYKIGNGAGGDKSSPARYRWAIETTLSIPEFEGVGHETDNEEVEILDL